MKTSPRYTKARRTTDFYNRMTALGFAYAETETLRRAQLTLHRWAERECNGEIEREGPDCDGRPYSGLSRTGRKLYVPDLEKGAWKRVLAAVEARNTRAVTASQTHLPNPYGTGFVMSPAADKLTAYHQTDPRGVSLYLVRESELKGQEISAVYNRGFAVCIG